MNGYSRLFALVFVLALAVAAVSTGNAQNPFAIQSIQPTTNGGIAITWSTPPGKSNQVIYTDSLSNSWQDLLGAQLLAGPNQYALSYTDYPAADVMQRFYRIKTTHADLVMSLVLDRSGSMGGNGGGLALPDAVSHFIDLFDDNRDRVSVNSFASGSTVDVPMRQPFKQDVKDAANVLVFNGWTCSERGLTNALAQNNSVAIPPGESVVKVIVFFTDGMANTWYYNFDCGPRDIDPNGSLWDPVTDTAMNAGCHVPAMLPSIDPSTGNLTANAVASNNCFDMHNEAQRRAERIAWLARSQGNYIYVIGMGSPGAPGECSNAFPVLNPDFLKNLANTPDSDTHNPSQPSGDYAIAANSAELAAVFQEIAVKLLSQ